MKITVDTKEDTKQEIQQSNLLLTKLIEPENEYYHKPHKQDRESDTTNAFANMFGATPATPTTTEDKAEETEEEEGPPRVEMY